MESPLLKLQYLRDNPPEEWGIWSKENQAQADKWEKEIEALGKIAEFHSQEIVQKIIERLISEVKGINLMLLDKDKRKDTNVDYLFAHKDAFTWLLRFIAGVDYGKKMKQIDEEIDAELERFNIPLQK